MRTKLLITSALLTCLAGCVTPPTAYVAHPFPTIQAEQISPVPQPLRLQVVTRRFRGDRLYDDVSPWVYSGAVQALADSRIIQPSPQGEDGKVVVIVKELDATTGDTAGGIAKGVLTGLTLGAIGSTTTGQFDVSLEITTHGKTITHPPARVDVSIRMGSASVPAGLASYRDANDALKQALSDAIFWTLFDMQQKGTLPSKTSH